MRSLDRPEACRLGHARTSGERSQPMRQTLLPALALASAIAIGGCLHAPMPWSPDGKWLAYTVEVRPVDRVLQPGWLFESPTATPSDPKAPGRPTAYRLWATRGDSGASVLLEESSHPLTAPGWSPDGRALAFGRVVPEADGSGRFEVVILEGPARRRVVVSRPLPEIGAEAGRLPGQAIAWSPDGRYLAIPQLNPLGLAIVRSDNGRQLNAINDAFLPSWSPDGSRLAFYKRGTGDTLNCIDSPTGQPRLLTEVGQAGQAAAWTRDGLTVVVVTRKSVPQGAEPPRDQAELLRVRVDNGLTETIQPLTSDAVLARDRSVEGVSIAFDSEGDNLFCSVVLKGEPHQITWYHPRERSVYKKFAILDFTAPMGSLSLSPDGRTLAARVGSIDRISAPALCDLDSTDLRSRLLAPDDSSRIEWIATLVTAARATLAALPTASTDPNVPSTARLDRPTMLPILGEFEANSEAAFRLRRIGKMGRPLCDRPANAPPADPEVAILLDEARLFFDYLLENHTAALASLDVLEGRAETPDRRTRLLAIRGQIYIAQGKVDRAMHTASYLKELERKPARRIEWTIDGYKVTDTEPIAGQGWPEYLAWRASQVRAMLHDEGPEDHPNPDAPRVNFGFDPVMPRGNLVFPDRPFLIDVIPPQDPAERRVPPPRPRPNREPGEVPKL